ncbi:MAG: hypothetical protein AAB556_02870 [Patescibacteria group bacterium]
MKNKKFILAIIALAAVLILPTNNSSPKPSPLNLRGGGDGGGVTIEARSALALDLLTGEILFEKNIYEPLPLASLTKIVSSLVIADHINLNDNVEITKSAVETPEPSVLKVGEYIRAEDLLAMAMGESSNDAMMALVEHFGDQKWFLQLIRQKALGLGAKTMIFLNPTGLDLGEVASNFGSAWDLAQVAKNSLDSIIWQVGNKDGLKHTNILRWEISKIIGAKTGFTDSAEGNLLIIIEHPLGKPKLIIILGSTIDGRFEEAKKLVKLLE